MWIAAVVGHQWSWLSSRRRGDAGSFLGLIACAFVIGGALLLSSALASKTSARVNDQMSVWDRQNQTSAGLRMLEAKPLFGFGWDRYTSDSLEYFRQSPNYPLGGYSTPEKPLPLHDTYLSYAVELGLIGASLWLIALLWGIGSGVFSRGQVDLRPWKLGLMAIMVFFLVVALFNPFQSAFTLLLLWVWSGVAWGCVPPSAQERRTTKMVALTRSDAAWAPA